MDAKALGMLFREESRVWSFFPYYPHALLPILGANGSSLPANQTFGHCNAVEEKHRLCSSHCRIPLSAAHEDKKVLALFIDEKMKALTDPVLWDQD